MKKTDCIILLCIGCIISLFFSCQTLTYHAVQTDDLTVTAQGRIDTSQSVKSHNSNDIVVSGNIMRSDAGQLFNDTALNVIVWTGKIAHAMESLPAKISFERSINKDGFYQMNGITVSQMPGYYQFYAFNIRDAGIMGGDYVRESELPVKIASFTIDGFEYGFYCIAISTVPTMKDNMSSVLQLMSEKEQLFQIIGSDGKVYAQFTDDSYQIYDTNPNVSPELFWPCIGVWSVIRDLCMNRV